MEAAGRYYNVGNYRHHTQFDLAARTRQMTISELINEVCNRGIESAKKSERGAQLEGAIAGFEAVRNCTTPRQLTDMLLQFRKDTQAHMDAYHNQSGILDDYWRARYAELQVEFVYEVVNVGMQLKPTMSARAARVYADIVGVKKP